MKHAGALKGQTARKEIDEEDLLQVSRINLMRSSERKTETGMRTKAAGGFKESTVQRKHKCLTLRKLTSDQV